MEFSILEQFGSFWAIISYIVTVIIGGVGFKFYQTYLSDKQTSDQTDIAVNQQAIDALMMQVSNFSEMWKQQGERILKLEDEVKKQHDQLLEATKAQLRAEAKVEILQTKSELLQTKLRYLEGLLEHYTDNPEDIVLTPRTVKEKPEGSDI